MALPRLHLFEIADQSWCPRILREGLTDYLRQLEWGFRPYDLLLPRLRAALARCDEERVLDLCSGAGGPWLPLLSSWEKSGGGPLEVQLSDQRPSPESWSRAAQASHGAIRPIPQPIDARNVPKDIPGFRTLFAAFHHFRPEEGLEIIRDAVRQKRGIAIFEVTQRTPRGILVACFAWLLVMIFTPLIRPVKLSRQVLTYLIPLIPALVTWDGLVSSLRSYTADEFGELVRQAGGDVYDWEIGEMPYPYGPFPTFYAIGTPRSSQT